MSASRSYRWTLGMKRTGTSVMLSEMARESPSHRGEVHRWVLK